MVKVIGAALLAFSGGVAAGNGKNLDFYNIKEQQLTQGGIALC